MNFVSFQSPLRTLHAAPASRPAGERWGLVLLAAVLLATLAHRLFLLFSTGFPINDGGLFYGFVEQIAPVFPHLPSTVTYNGLELPFAYPPLAFWLVALAGRLGVDTMAIFHAAPILMNLVYVALFALLLKRSGGSTMFVAVAMLFFCSALRSFEWLIMGGGLPRGLGSLFMLATLLAIGIPDGKERRVVPTPRLVLAGVFVAGAIVTHLEWGLNAAAAVVLSRAFASPGIKDFVRGLLIAGFTALVLVSPWLWFVYSAHGLEPFLVAADNERFTNVPALEAITAILFWVALNPLVPLGFALSLARRQYFWPAFFAMAFVLTPRHFLTPATMPLAILAATGLMWVASALLQPDRSKAVGWTVILGLILLVLVPRYEPNFVGRGESVHALRAPQLAAMEWVARTHPGDAFVVLERYGWWTASSAEWFPVLAHARSTNTVQGGEWIKGDYKQVYRDDLRLKIAVAQRLAADGRAPAPSCGEIRNRISAFKRPRFLWAEVVQDCFASSRFKPVYRNGAVTIYELVPGALSS